jgi:transketolase
MGQCAESAIMSDSRKLAADIRRSALLMVTEAKASHIGGALSMADILAVLYSGVMRVRPAEPDWPERDRLILSKGHSCTGLYAALAHKGYFPMQELGTYAQDDSRLMSHISHKVPGVEFSTGSLGHGLPFGVGKALAAHRQATSWRTYVIVSDGELDEGSNWEAILLAPHHRLSSLTLIVDYNKIQSLGRVEEVISLGDLEAKFRAFDWDVRICDGHDHDALRRVMGAAPLRERPVVILAHTIKGKGVSFMEDQLLWHYRNPDAAQFKQAEQEIQASLQSDLHA